MHGWCLAVCVQLALLFSMQGLGKLLCALVLLCCVHIKDTNAQWRVAILMGGWATVGSLFLG